MCNHACADCEGTAKVECKVCEGEGEYNSEVCTAYYGDCSMEYPECGESDKGTYHMRKSINNFYLTNES